MLTLLERLTPVERAAYLLREVFGYEYAEIARIIERTEVNARQLVTRARKHLEAGRPRFDADEAARYALLERFLAAAEEGDLAALEELLAKDAVLYADGGGKALASRCSAPRSSPASWPAWLRCAVPSASSSPGW
jgi:RNA polymerase sigma-70 factor (ECF subfamily)